MERFYVYELVDPRSGAAFYVGKGQGRRIHHHEAEAAKGAHSQKCDRIRAIWAAGLKVDHRVVSRFADENEALQAEFDLIAEYGLDALTNVVPGGVMGAKVYFERIAAAERRKEAKAREDIGKSFAQIAPQIAMVLKAKAAGGQVGAWVGGRWLDFTGAFYALFESILGSHGHEFVANALKPYGVTLKEA